MAKFTYRMQNILEIKRKLESQAKIAYMVANGKLTDEQEKLQRILLTRASYENKTRTLERGRLDVNEIMCYHNAIETMKDRQKVQMRNVHAAEKNVEIARENLNQVMIERKTHEKLREKAFDEFKQEIRQQEAKEVDEMVSYNYHEA